MKKILIFGIPLTIFLGLALLLSFGIVRYAYAQTISPVDEIPILYWGKDMWEHTPMMQDRRGSMMGYHDESDPMYDYTIAALAKTLDLSAENLQSRIKQGETPYEIAQAQGLSDEQIRDLFVEIRKEMLQKAVDEGILTQEQLDWMEEHHEQMDNTEADFGDCIGRGRRALGQHDNWYRWP